MNARQKAKKYKKLAERYKDKANAWDAYLRYSNKFYDTFRKHRYGTIETLRVSKYWDDRVPEEFLKEKIAEDFAECLIRDGYIDFKVEDNYDEYGMKRRVIGTLLVAKGWNNEDYY